jgi:paired amphipathic helix protein Sin3a
VRIKIKDLYALWFKAHVNSLGYKIELTPEEEAYGRASREAQLLGMRGPSFPTIGMTDSMGNQLPPHLQYTSSAFPQPANNSTQPQQQTPQMQQHIQQQIQQQMQQQQQQQMLQSGAAIDGDGLPTGAFTKPPQQMQQQHAISYVTTIRNRFAKEPDTYRAFLKILHTYQKEQKGIKEVLEQVSELFADHPDLLMEFTYFLPDAVQDQAKERLHRAAKESVVRRKLAAKNSALLMKGGGGVPGAPSPSQQLSQVGSKRSRTDKEREKAEKDKFDVLKMESNALKDKFAASKMQASSAQASTSNARKTNRRQGPGGMPYAGQTQPSTNVTFCHTSSERRFFDQVKDLLTSVTREPWSEFVRCLELFNQQLIDRANMLSLVQELFAPPGGAGTSELFDEFRQLLDTRTSFESRGHEVWYAIPLSEIDFSQCRKCTPSYRALPKDFPPVQCSETGAIEMAVLNTGWVSIPIGSEESSSFKHMRKNQYEEALFKCEDERFEIDMVIDSNLCAIKLLEPIAEELASLRTLETTSHHVDKNNGGLKFSLQLEKRNFGQIHLNAISRIYGENGPEILELLRKNPAGTVPVVLRRLKQKDYEWRRARQDLDKQWREVLERNYERMFDHRSFYFRQQDRRFYSPRHLVGDIKTRAGLAMTPPVPPAATEAEELLLGSVGVTATLSASLTAVSSAPFHLCLSFDSIDPVLGDLSHHNHVIHKDVYRLLCYAAETGGLSQSDKERISALWRDFIRVFFNMPVHYLHSAASCEDTEEVEVHVQAWTAGARVLTIYGQGEVLEFRPVDGMYRIQLAYGVGFVSASTIIGAEQLSTQALQAIGVGVDAETGAERILNVSAPAPAPANAVSDPCRVFFGTQMCYVFLRLYQTIFTRLLCAKQLAASATQTALAAEVNNNNAYSQLDRKGALRSRPMYNSFLGQLMGALDGSVDGGRYEESLRLLLGNKSFILLTLDKVVQQAIKCLQVMANDESVNKLVGLFIYHRTRATRVDTSLYQVTPRRYNSTSYRLLISRGTIGARRSGAVEHAGGSVPPAACGVGERRSNSSGMHVLGHSIGGPDRRALHCGEGSSARTHR